MASSSRVHAEREPLSSYEPEGFDDFTLASSWERFISEIEATCRLWLADGPNNLVRKNALQVGSLKNLYKVKFDSKYGMKSYCLEYYFELHTTAHNAEWKDELHSLQLQFGVKEFLVISPLSASGVILDEPEATKLLSSVAIALSNCGCNWPAFVPVHDPTRKAHIGIQNMGMIFTRRYEADRIGSQVPIKFMHLEGIYELFLSKFAFARMDYAIHPAGVHFTMRLTYRTPPYDDDNEGIYVVAENSESNGNSEAVCVKTLWDDDCPWAEWYSAEDPIKGFELIATWSKRAIGSSTEMAEFENASTNEADHWYLVPIVPTHMIIGPNIDVVGFASQLQLLVNALNTSFEAKFIEDLASADNQTSDNGKSSTLVPPPTVLDRVLKDLFHAGSSVPSAGDSEHKLSKAIKGAPLESLFAQFCLHSLWFGMCNIRAISVLWIEFVREVRWCWEESQPLPRMVNNGVIDLSSCLIHQKLQMLAFCTEKKQSMHERASSCVGNDKYVEVYSLENTEEKSNVEGTDYDIIGDTGKKPIESSSGVDGIHQSACSSRRGSAGVIKDMMLLKSHQLMHAPITQDPPLMTEDMHEERLQAIEAFSTPTLKSFSAQLEKDTLSSDMSAFKAANPDAVFEDFIRWHSPGDWESEINDAAGSEKFDGSPRSEWPPKGKLSERMSEYGNSWRQMWNEVHALAALEQKPILDPNREGEKVLHYLETLRPHQLLEQMVCTAFRASADILNQTSFGQMNQMKIKIEQLYRTIASMLKSLKAFHEDDRDDFINNDLVRLCHAFHQVEQLLIFAASIHRKLLHAPRLCQGVFDDYYKFYSRRMGTSSVEISNDEEFHVKKSVRMHERDTVSDLFRPPTANQSWRKVLSMGNLLNGHEPLLREIIFSVHKSMSGNHYGTTLPNDSETDIETHRMFVCGTSNDLQVALSVTSCD
ncbi:uncharacterized protein LOC116254766 [Nymphaea colorata]|nr:uncharacterized protein LOC116254766 [Nymphaea colorata]